MTRVFVLIAVVGAGSVGAAACGTTDSASREPLPPLRTTTSSTTIPATTLPPGVRIIYTVKPGDTLGIIAASFQVTVASIVDLNQLPNGGNNIQAGQKIEIPNILFLEELPDAGDTTVP